MELKNIIMDIISEISLEVNQPSVKHRINTEILDPFIQYIIQQLYPYLIITCIIFVLMFLCIISTLILILYRS